MTFGIWPETGAADICPAATKTAEERSKIAEGIIEHSPSVALRIKLLEDGSWQTEFISRNIEDLGYRWDDFNSGRLTWKDIVHPDDYGALMEALNAYEKQLVASYTVYYRILRADKTPLWVCDNTTVQMDENGQPLYYDCVLTDYSMLKKSLEKNEDNLLQQKVLNEILQSLHMASPSESFNTIFDRVGTYLNVSRVLLFRDSSDGKFSSAVYEWCNSGIPSLISRGNGGLRLHYVAPPHATMPSNEMYVRNYGDAFHTLFLEAYRDDTLAEVMIPLYLEGQRYGFICFDECVLLRVWKYDTLSFLKNIARLASAALMRKKTAEALADSHQTLQTVLGNVGAYLFVSEIETGRIIFANEAFRRDFGGDWESLTCKDLVCRSEGCSCVTCAAQSTWCRGTGYSEIYLESLGEWLGVTASYIVWVDGHKVRLVDSQVITAQKMYEENIKRQAFIDYLTGLPNRYRCDEDLALAIREAKINNETGYVVFLDMDDFKLINDSYGHDYGDTILVEFANFLRDELPGVDHVYRFGGDEFVLLLKNRSENEVMNVVDTLMSRTILPWNTQGKQFYCTVSLGIVRYPDEESDVKDVIRNADIAMYQVKNTGKNNYYFYSSDLENDSVRRVEMERMIRDAIQNDFQGFEVYYQPILSLPDQKIIGAEALVRWFDETGHIVMPDQFIALSEYLGLIVPIGDFVIRQSLQLCKTLNESGFPDFQVSVNVSMRQFQQRDFVTHIDNLLAQCGVNCTNIIFEVTEGMAVSDLQRMRLMMDELRVRGISLAMDDFGTGYSSLNNLRTLPVDIIKIDRTFIRDITVDAYSDAFIRMITDLGHSISKQICIEGVETAEQLAYCLETGANLLQGFYFCKPIPRAQLVDMLRTKGDNPFNLPQHKRMQA